MIGRTIANAVIFGALSGASLATTPTANLKLLSSVVSRPAMSEIIPICERTLRIKVDVAYANNPIVKKQIEDGGAFDVAVIEPHMLADLESKGLIKRGSISHLAKIDMAMMSLANDAPVRIDTVEAFRRALLKSRSVVYHADGHSGTVFLATLDRLGLRQALAAKLVPHTGPQSPIESLRNGKAQYYVAPIAMPVPSDMRFVGRFPGSIQTYVGISAGTSLTAAPSSAAFRGCLASAKARAVFIQKAYLPPQRAP